MSETTAGTTQPTSLGSAEIEPFVETEENRQISLRLVLWLWIPACIIAYLLGGLPYSSGYGFIRVPLTSNLETLWKLPDWEHCFLVPFAVAFMIYEKREQLASLPLKPNLLFGGLVVVFGFLIYWAGYRVDNNYFGYFSIQILLAGMILLQLGWRYMLALLFPWLFLGFMWPLLFLESMLAFPLRQIMSEASTATLNLLGIPSMRVGTAILSAPDQLTGLEAGELFSVDVADPCSGIRSLFALMMVSALYGFFAMKTWWKQAILFATSIPLAVCGNLIRILLLTIGTLMFGADFAIGEGLEDPSTFHMVAGFFVFAVALGGMLLVAKALNTDYRAWWTQATSGNNQASGTEDDPGKEITGKSAKRNEDLY